jgi:hypothetical protein
MRTEKTPPKKHLETAIPWMVRLFNGLDQRRDPTVDQPIQAEKLSEFLETNFGYKDGRGIAGERKCTNVRACVNYIRSNQLAPICSAGKAGYFRGTQPEHFDKTYSQLYQRVQGLMNPIEGIRKMKQSKFGEDVKSDYSDNFDMNLEDYGL